MFSEVIPSNKLFLDKNSGSAPSGLFKISPLMLKCGVSVLSLSQ